MNLYKHDISKILLGDIREKFSEIENGSIQCIVTSPPYFGHRDYSGGNPKASEIGKETTVEQYVQNLSSTFQKLLPKLSHNGLLWLNIGDTYRDNRQLGVPWQVALALANNGWILRSDIIWNKPNAMPSSVKSRPTVSHEYIFLFSKSKDYYYNADAIREPHVTFSKDSKMRGGRNHFGKRNGTPEQGKNGGSHNLHDGRWDQAFHPLGRNKRTVWEIPLSKYRGAHFAVFPEKLVETCILAASRKGDLVFDPFTGSGTTGVVALKHGRRFLGVELYPSYKAMAEERILHTQKQGGLEPKTLNKREQNNLPAIVSKRNSKKELVEYNVSAAL